MNRNISIFFFVLFFFAGKLYAQTDDYSGTWQMNYQPASNSPVIFIELKIASPERGLLYPAQLKLRCDSFNSTYELLLVKKNLRQLGISKNKFPRSEESFSMGDWTIALNGTLDFSKDLKGEWLLTINRLPAKNYGVTLPSFLDLSEAQKKTAMDLSVFLKDAEIVFKKTNSIPWQNENTDKILMPSLSPDYFGIKDTVHVQTRDGLIKFSGNRKAGNDIVSVVLNGRTIIDQVEPAKKKDPEEFLLDTGLNIIAMFADNFKKSLPNKAKMDLETGNKKFRLDFTNKPDVAATFIVAKLYYDKDKNENTKFQTYSPDDPSGNVLNRNDKIIGNIISTSRQITLALWDDAVEDGDSVSININGKWIVQGFPVKKNPQFISVKLEPGPNTITFAADNLGSIPPNTSILEIIDGKKRKSFNIETNLFQNNLVKIFYDYKPE